MDSLPKEIEKNALEKRKPIYLVITGLIACGLLSVFGLAYYFVNFNKSAILLPIVGPTPEESHTYAEGDLDTARSYIKNGNCDMALPLLDGVIANTENNGGAYYYRGYCYYTLTNNQTVEEIYLKNASLALADADKAILYGPGDLSIQTGDPYYLRYLIFSAIQGTSQRRADRDYLGQLMLENLKIAIAYGNSDEYSYRLLPLVLFSLGRCEEGQAELVRVHQEDGLSAPPSASLYNIGATGYLCTGDYEKALESMDKGLALDVYPERLYLRAIILYHMGRLDESLAVLNQLIEDRSNYSGMRYYLRALIYYEMDKRDLAEADLQLGAANTWGGGGVDAYVLGLMAMEDGNNELAIQYLQQAHTNLVWLYDPLLSKIEKDLGELGAEPLNDEVTSDIISTPMSVPDPRPVPKYQVNSYGFQLPVASEQVTASMETGAPSYTFIGFDYPIFLFVPSQDVQVKSVQKLMVHMRPDIETKDIPIRVLLWQPTTGEWTIISATPDIKDIEIENPKLYVDGIGQVYISIFRPHGRRLHLDNLWLTLEITTSDGDQLNLGKGVTP